MNSIEHVLRLAARELAQTSPTPELDSQLLLSYVTGKNRLQLLMDSKEQLSSDQLEKFNYCITRRSSSEPVAYITGVKEFWGLDFKVSSAVLVPRPETEILIENFLSLAENFPDPLLVCDLGTGSGCIAISAAFELKRRGRNFFVLAVDKSLEAIKIARENAKLHAVDDYVHFVCGSWASAIGADFDFVLTNPPYLDSDEKEISPELKYEPASALYSGPRGIDDYRIIFEQLPKVLSPDGVLLGEFGYGQYPLLYQLASELLPAAKVSQHPDLRKIPRILELQVATA